jgi:hypothetical protein
LEESNLINTQSEYNEWILVDRRRRKDIEEAEKALAKLKEELATSHKVTPVVPNILMSSPPPGPSFEFTRYATSAPPSKIWRQDEVDTAAPLGMQPKGTAQSIFTGNLPFGAQQDVNKDATVFQPVATNGNSVPTVVPDTLISQNGRLIRAADCEK